jgi:glycosyltransferase involved in cell wall biosynthesis
VVPAFNEEDNIVLLYSGLKMVLEKGQDTFEIIFIDDGSTDSTFEVLKEIVKENEDVTAIKLARRFGQSSAILAGFRNSSGDIVITLDADLQNDPKDIPRLVQRLREGYDVVCGWRRHRKDPFLSKIVPSHISNWIARRLTGLKIHDFGCTFRAYRRQVVDEMELYGEKHRYIPALASLEGFSVTEIEVEHHPRRYGKTKYSILRTLRGLTDLLVIALERYEARPTYFFTGLGIATLLFGLVLIIGLSISWTPLFQLSWETLLLLGILPIVVGFNLITAGILSEMILKVRYDVENRKFYKIREIAERRRK